MNNGTGQPMHLPTAAFPWAACELDAQQVLCYCHSYVGARQTQRSVSQLLINPDELRKTAVPAQCVTPALQSNWALFPSYRNFMCFLKLDLAFSHQKVKKNFISVALLLMVSSQGCGDGTAHGNERPHYASFARTRPKGQL